MRPNAKVVKALRRPDLPEELRGRWEVIRVEADSFRVACKVPGSERLFPMLSAPVCEVDGDDAGRVARYIAHLHNACLSSSPPEPPHA